MEQAYPYGGVLAPWGHATLHVEGVALATTRVMPHLDRRGRPMFEEALARAMRVPVSNPLERLNRAGFLAALDRVPEALDEATQALADTPAHEAEREAAAALTIGVLRVRQGALGEALGRIEQAAGRFTRAPHQSRAQTERAGVLLALGRTKEAVVQGRAVVRDSRGRKRGLELARALTVFAECLRAAGRSAAAQTASAEAAELFAEILEPPMPWEERDLIYAALRDEVAQKRYAARTDALEAADARARRAWP